MLKTSNDCKQVCIKFKKQNTCGCYYMVHLFQPKTKMKENKCKKKSGHTTLALNNKIQF